jgi:serine/threonine-protein kinase
VPSEELQRQRCAYCNTELPHSALTCTSCGRAVARSTHTPITGHVLLGKWQLDRKLGQGGMGAVYLAHELELDRQVAVKMLSDTLCDDAELVARFEREARMMARLDHPNLVPIYAVGREGRVPFIVMKSLAGATLAHYLKERGRLPVREVLSISRQLCAGLQFIHDHGVIHRDVKPGNVFIAADGHVTLLDLGVARDAGSALTRSGVLIGTPRYMSPEQISAHECDHRSDLYSLATVIYEMLIGTTVFPSESDFSVMRAHVDLPPPDLTKVDSVPRPLAEALLEGLAKQPGERFQSAREFSEALERVAGLPEVRALPDPPARAAPLLVPVSAPLALLPAGGTHIDASLPPTSPSRRRGMSRRAGLLIAVLVAVVGAVSGVTAVEVWATKAKAPAPPPPPPAPVVVKPEPPPPPEPAPAPAPQPAPVVAVEPPKPAKPVAMVKHGPGEVRCVTTTADGEASWAYVDVDGMRRGTTPLTLKLPPGEHEVVFRRPGFQTQTRKVSAVAGEVTRVSVELKP